MYGGFDTSLKGFHNVDLWYRVAKKYTFHYINSPLIIFHHHKQNRLMTWDEKRWRAYYRYLRKWKEEIIRIGGQDAYLNRIKKNKEGLFIENIQQNIIKKGRLFALKNFLSASFKRGLSFSVFLNR